MGLIRGPLSDNSAIIRRTVIRKPFSECSECVVIMPKTNCCVPHCHATSKRHKHLSWHVLPRDETLRKRWIVLIRNDNLRVSSKGTSVCGLHFRGGRRTYDENTPTIFPWTPEWTGLVNDYNKKVTDESSSLMNDHQYSSDSVKPALLTLDIPELSACSPAVRRLRKRITKNSSPDMSSPPESLSLSVSSYTDKNK